LERDSVERERRRERERGEERSREGVKERERRESRMDCIVWLVVVVSGKKERGE
jgi:hypothetical protein